MAPTYLKEANPAAKAAGVNPSLDVPGIVKGVIDTIRKDGDDAVRRYSEQFDKWSPNSFKLSKADIEHAISQVSEQVLRDIQTVQSNVRKFALAQKDSLNEFELEMAPGVFLGQKHNPIDSVGT